MSNRSYTRVTEYECDEFSGAVVHPAERNVFFKSHENAVKYVQERAEHWPEGELTVDCQEDIMEFTIRKPMTGNIKTWVVQPFHFED